VFEQALVAGGDVRLRMVATLKLRQLPGEAELDVEVCVTWYHITLLLAVQVQ
jgi:hypothetical protein